MIGCTQVYKIPYESKTFFLTFLHILHISEISPFIFGWYFLSSWSDCGSGVGLLWSENRMNKWNRTYLVIVWSFWKCWNREFRCWRCRTDPWCNDWFTVSSWLALEWDRRMDALWSEYWGTYYPWYCFW